MQNPLASFRLSAFALVLLLAAAPPLSADTNTPPQQQAPDKNDKGGKKRGPNDLRGLPNIDTGRTAVDSNLSTSGSDRSDRSGTPPGTAASGSAAQARENAASGLNESATQRPGFNQGFDSADKAELEKKTEEFKRNNGNPLTAVTGGRRTDGAGPAGVAAQGTAAISNGGVTSAAGAKFDANGVSATLKSPARNVNVIGVYSSVGSGPAAAILQETEGFGTASAAPATPAAPAAPEPPLNTAANPNVKIHPSGAVTETSNNGNTKTYTSADGREVSKITTDPKTGARTVEKTITADDGTTTTTTTTASSCQGIDGCNDAAARAEFLRNNPASAAQINQARNGAADSEVNPNREGNVAIDRSVALPTTSQVGRNLFGQPGQVVETSGGGRTGVDFNGGAGAIDPGDDAVIAGRGRQDDPGDVFNNQPGPQSGAVQAPPSSSSDCEEKKPATKRLTSVGTSKPAKKDDCAP